MAMVVEAQWGSCDDEGDELDVPQGLFEEVGRVLRRLPFGEAGLTSSRSRGADLDPFTRSGEPPFILIERRNEMPGPRVPVPGREPDGEAT